MIVTKVKKNGLEEKLKNQVFTGARFILAQQMARMVLLFLPFCFWLSWRYRALITHYGRFTTLSVKQSLQDINNVFSTNTRRQNRNVLIVLLLAAGLYLLRMATGFLNYDELWSYNYYTANPFYYSFFTYSSYPLFELTTHFFKWLPFDMKINLRLSSFFFAVGACTVLYSCLKTYFKSHFTAMAGLAGFAFMPFTVVYATTARGPLHELFFAIAGLFSFVFWLTDTSKKRFLVVYLLAGVMGVYALSPHIILLIFLFATGLWKCKTNQAALKPFLKTNVSIAIACALLYAPILLTSGFSVIQSLAGTRTSLQASFLWLPHFLRNIVAEYAGYSTVVLISFSIAVPLLFYTRKKIPGNQRIILMLITGMPLSVIIFYLLTGLPYPGRSVPFAALGIPLLICLFVQSTQSWFNNSKYRVKGIAVAAIGLALAGNGFLFLPVIPADREVYQVSKLFLDNKIISCYDNSSALSGFFYYYPGLEYYFRTAKKTIQLELNDKNSMRYKPLQAVNDYDCIVFDAPKPDSIFANSFHEIYRDERGRFKILLRNTLR